MLGYHATPSRVVGVTVGYHRLFTHRSFKTTRPVRAPFGDARLRGGGGPGDRMGLHAPEASPLHRPPGRPPQPARRPRDGLAGALRGLFHAHVGWMLPGNRPRQSHSATPRICSTTRSCARSIGRSPLWVLARTRCPVRPRRRADRLGRRWPDRAAVGRGGPDPVPAPRDLLDQLALPLLRPPTLPNRRRVAQPRLARACPTFGEAWHNNHHAFPTSAHHGLGRAQLDPGGWLIDALEQLGLAWDVVRITPAAQQAKLTANVR